jgi:hypothetical protein
LSPAFPFSGQQLPFRCTLKSHAKDLGVKAAGKFALDWVRVAWEYTLIWLE